MGATLMPNGLINHSGNTSNQPSGSSGQLFYNTELQSLMIHDGSAWKKVYEPPLGSSSANPASSCKAIVNAGKDNGDGYYYITVSPGVVLQLFCDMTFNPTAAGFGRGWTKVAVGCQPTSARYGSVQPTSVTDQYNYTTEWKLSDTEIQNVRDGGIGIWIRGTVVHTSDASRLLKITEAWHSDSAMGDDGGTNQQWTGSSWNSMGTCAGEDRGPSQCTPSGWYFGGESYTSTTGAASDLRWYYSNWSNHCLFRAVNGGDDSRSGPGSHSTYVY